MPLASMAIDPKWLSSGNVLTLLGQGHVKIHVLNLVDPAGTSIMQRLSQPCPAPLLLILCGELQ